MNLVKLYTTHKKNKRNRK